MTGLDAALVAATADTIVAAQAADGQIAWFPCGQTDPWDHVEAAMALDVAGRPERAEAAYEWLALTQNPDGSWFRGYQGDEATDRVRETNFTAYLAVGLLHHIRSTGVAAVLDRLWPTVVRAVTFVLDHQRPGGEIVWAAGAHEALLTGCSSMYHSLRCAIALGEAVGHPQPDWELAAALLGHAVACHAEAFADKSRFSMDWYYPVLGGSVRGAAAERMIKGGWDTFVVPGVGVRCVSDEPWVTAAETCELAIALDAIGQRDQALELFAQIQFLRAAEGSYWTGWQFQSERHYPNEQSSYTAAAVVLAADVLGDGNPSPAVAVFRAAAAGPDVSQPVNPAACGCPALPDAEAVASPLEDPQRAGHADLFEGA